MSYLNDWCNQYEVPIERITFGYDELGDHYLGMSYHKWRKDERITDIRINVILIRYRLAVMAVTWHEFCHAEKWIKDGQTDGHGDAWSRRLWRKPFLAFYSMLPAKIVFAYAKLKR